MIKITKVELLEIELYRIDYLNSLPEFQELYLELFVENGEVYKIVENKFFLGYFIKTEDNILVEFYLIDQHKSKCEAIFQTIINEITIESIYCKSFDALLLNYCMKNKMKYEIMGTLFRNYVHSDFFVIPNISVRVAEMRDYPFLLQQEGDLYETPEELERFVSKKNVILFHKDDQLIGCGYLIKIHKQFNYYDIGMWVNPNFRQQGIATMIISYLKNHCIKNNWIPIAGCAADNIASQKTLEKNGFYSQYSFIEFQF